MRNALERAAGTVTAVNPYSGVTEQVSNFLADQAEMRLLHMITADPARNATFTFWSGRSLPRTKTLPVAASSSPKMAWATSLRPAPTNPAGDQPYQPSPIGVIPVKVEDEDG